jgi:DNA-binding NarL/FixJ family response regulator
MKKVLEEMDDIKIVGEANDGLELLNLLKKLTPHMVILDISMPNLRGIEATHEIKVMNPEIKVLILTMHKSRDYLYYAISAGAEGYVLKEDADTDLFSAIERIRKGKTYISPILSEELTDDLVQVCRGKHKIPSDHLTPREREVVKLVAEGKTNKEIAHLLFVSVRTVEKHRANIMKKAKLKTTSELIKYAIEKGYTSDNRQLLNTTTDYPAKSRSRSKAIT